MSVGWQVVWTAFPAFLVGHAAMGLLLADIDRRSVWKPLMVVGYGASLLCVVVGIFMVIWS